VDVVVIDEGLLPVVLNALRRKEVPPSKLHNFLGPERSN
jgi:hypothetical protein